MPAEIQRLQLLERCRKPAGEEPAESLRRIFDTESQSVGNTAAPTLAFGEIESFIKCRRRLLPLLLTDATDVSARITGVRDGMCDGQQIFRGSVNTSNGRTAYIFASDSQLDLLSATSALTALYCRSAISITIHYHKK